MSDESEAVLVPSMVHDAEDADGAQSSDFAIRRAGGSPISTVPLAVHAPPRDRAASTRTASKPCHYKVICISLYTDDLKRLDGLVDQLKQRGIAKANRSALIRYALEQVDLDKVPKAL